MSPDGSWLATGHDDGTIHVWDTKTRQEAGPTLEGHEDQGNGNLVLNIAWSPDGHTLATAAQDGKVRLWDLRSFTSLGSLSRPSDHLQSVAFTPSGDRLVTAWSDGVIRFWNLDTRRQEPDTIRFSTTLESINELFFNTSGDVLYGYLALDSETQAGALRSWTLPDLQERHPIDIGQGDAVTGVSVDRTGELLVAATERPYSVLVWRLSTGELLGSWAYDAGGGAIVHVAMSPDRRLLAVATPQRRIELFSTTGLVRFASLDVVPRDGATDLAAGPSAFAPDGQSLHVLTSTGTLGTWHTPLPARLVTACASSRATRCAAANGMPTSPASPSATLAPAKAPRSQLLRIVSAQQRRRTSRAFDDVASAGVRTAAWPGWPPALTAEPIGGRADERGRDLPGRRLQHAGRRKGRPGPTQNSLIECRLGAGLSS